jgi:hypothetical protein
MALWALEKKQLANLHGDWFVFKASASTCFAWLLG